MRASGDPSQQAEQIAALAIALDEDGAAAAPSQEPTTESINNVNASSSATLPPPPPDATIALTETEVPTEIVGTQPFVITTTPRPTRTAIPTLAAPFKLTGQEEVCDSNLPDGLLQVVVLNSNRRQAPGVQIVITWDGGDEQFFTGLKPELGNGYADYIMTPNTTYTVQLALGSDVATGITIPTCQTGTGENFLGGIKLTFQQP
jgi:hypothetical protein